VSKLFSKLRPSHAHSDDDGTCVCVCMCVCVCVCVSIDSHTSNHADEALEEDKGDVTLSPTLSHKQPIQPIPKTKSRVSLRHTLRHTITPTNSLVVTDNPVLENRVFGVPILDDPPALALAMADLDTGVTLYNMNHYHRH
jgi:hypothetical protein